MARRNMEKLWFAFEGGNNYGCHGRSGGTNFCGDHLQRDRPHMGLGL